MNGAACTLPVDRICQTCGKTSRTVAGAQDHRRRVHGVTGTNGATPCPYKTSEDCSGFIRWFASSAVFYNGADYGPVWGCLACRAWVGCHKGTTRPKGTVANGPLRAARAAVHADFDPIWRRQYVSRDRAYELLAERLEIEPAACHVGMFDLDMCKRAIAVLQVLGPELARAARPEARRA